MVKYIQIKVLLLTIRFLTWFALIIYNRLGVQKDAFFGCLPMEFENKIKQRRINFNYIGKNYW
jgi:hypothetical protein